ncbi:unnamed protein product [Euphydryas editha]|uniref:Uncharacterized protein n=1 Tax=Euphydryas editha TaxID=104508 RepID=A0AAU9UBX7_EUPED|nr:unnamed protein product [Euphydryas editha]
MHLTVPTIDEPSDYGWLGIGNRFEFISFSGTQPTYNLGLPTSIDQITIQPEEADSSDSDSDGESERDESDSSQSENENDLLSLLFLITFL